MFTNTAKKNTPIKLMNASSPADYNDDGEFVDPERTESTHKALIRKATQSNTSFTPDGLARIGVDWVANLASGEAYPERQAAGGIIPASLVEFNGIKGRVKFSDIRPDRGFGKLLIEEIEL
jgi:hypothetical protein